jgi:short-subunit dehydrogenase
MSLLLFKSLLPSYNNNNKQTLHLLSLLTTTTTILAAILLHRVFIHERKTLKGGSTRKDGKKRRILISGGASGIGFETAKLFKSRGWEVGIVDINLDALKKACEELLGNGNNIWYSVCDVCDPDSCARVVKEFAHYHGDNKFDVLFNSAGILQTGLFKNIPLGKQTAQVRVNVEGVINLTYCALPYLNRHDEGGRIITMASGSAQSGIPYHACYAATKAAIYSLTEALNIEFHRDNISVADVSVMYVATNMVKTQENTNTLLLRRSDLFITPDIVAKRVWDAVYQCRLHREHFYVETSLNAAFKFTALCRALGVRWGMRIVALTNLPPPEE